MGFFDNVADKFDDAKRSAKRSAKRARKATSSDTTLEAAGKIIGKTAGNVAGAVAVTAMEFGSTAYGKIVEKNEELNELKEEFRRYDDDRILAMSVLKERGYDFKNERLNGGD